jgi:tight adherence protein C
MLDSLVRHSDPWMFIAAGLSVTLLIYSVYAIYQGLVSSLPVAIREQKGPQVSSPLLKLFIVFGRPLGQIMQPFIERSERKFQRTGQESFLMVFRQRLATDIRSAGNPEGISPDEFIGIMIFSTILFGMWGYLFYLMYPIEVIILVFMAGGILVPRLWLGDLARKRRKEIRRTLPYALDLLTLAVEAGLDFTTALSRISTRIGNSALGMEFRILIQEIQMGKIRADALRDMANRVAVFELTSVVSSLVQTDELGAPLGPVLRIQSDFIRTRRAQEAEEIAMKMPVKLLFPLLAFIFPAAGLMILGPVIIRYWGTMGGI